MFSRPCPPIFTRIQFSAKARVEQKRFLSLHEHQSQEMLKEFMVPVPKGRLARTPNEARDFASALGGNCVLKSQIQAGGRGKGKFDSGLKGGIQVVKTPEEAFRAASNMLGHRLVTKQTSSSGLLVDKVYVAETMKYKDEMYLAMTLDRAKYCPAIIISKEGGVDIETLAKKHPEKLHKFWFNASTGVTPELIEAIQAKLELPQGEVENFEKLLKNMAKLFVAKDALLLEINPLVRTEQGDFICLDAKFNIDNAAKNRQKDLFALQDVATRSPDELEAEKHGLVYINLDGDIGNVVNGAGLAMATNDAISLYGGKSANFLDAGGLATKETFQKALEIILRDPRVKSILVNIYGGLTRCDFVAESIIGAAAEIGPLRVPLVVRLQGTNSAEGLKLINESGLGLHTESEFGDAAKAAVEYARNASNSQESQAQAQAGGAS